MIPVQLDGYRYNTFVKCSGRRTCGCLHAVNPAKQFASFVRRGISNIFTNKRAVASEPSELVKTAKIIIIGAGVSGLVCAKELISVGETDLLVIDAADEVGGRIRYASTSTLM